jgi:hypothetical protein
MSVAPKTVLLPSTFELCAILHQSVFAGLSESGPTGITTPEIVRKFLKVPAVAAFVAKGEFSQAPDCLPFAALNFVQELLQVLARANQIVTTPRLRENAQISVLKNFYNPCHCGRPGCTKDSQP